MSVKQSHIVEMLVIVEADTKASATERAHDLAKWMARASDVQTAVVKEVS